MAESLAARLSKIADNPALMQNEHHANIAKHVEAHRLQDMRRTIFSATELARIHMEDAAFRGEYSTPIKHFVSSSECNVLEHAVQLMPYDDDGYDNDYDTPPPKRQPKHTGLTWSVQRHDVWSMFTYCTVNVSWRKSNK